METSGATAAPATGAEAAGAEATAPAAPAQAAAAAARGEAGGDARGGTAAVNVALVKAVINSAAVGRCDGSGWRQRRAWAASASLSGEPTVGSALRRSSCPSNTPNATVMLSSTFEYGVS